MATTRKPSEGGAFLTRWNYIISGLWTFANRTNTPPYFDDGTSTLASLVTTTSTQTLTNKTLTAPTITGSLGTKTLVTPTGAGALTAAQSGADILLNAAAGFAITLPAPAAGLHYRITVAAVFATTNFTVATASGANIIEGSIIVAGVVVDADARDTINFVATAENIGDFVELWSDGTSWFVFGNALTSGGITFSVT